MEPIEAVTRPACHVAGREVAQAAYRPLNQAGKPTVFYR
jgi:hypothetical protein